MSAPAAVRWTAWLMAAWCLGFAAVNVGLQVTGALVRGPLAPYASGLTVMQVLVVVLKLLGAAVAVLAVVPGPARPAAGTRTMLVWGAFALLALYVLGGCVDLVRLLLAGSDEVTARSLAYLAFLATGAVGYGVLACFRLRAPGQRRYAVVGALGAPVLLGLVLGAVPALLTGAGLLPA